MGVGEAVPDQHRADSLNTGWVKVPVEFPALAVVGSEQATVRTLASRIERELKLDHWKHCAICEQELNRVWPKNDKDREATIAQFATAHGFRLSTIEKVCGPSSISQAKTHC